jgi:phosphatidylinositol-3-phosphatase
MRVPAKSSLAVAAGLAVLVALGALPRASTAGNGREGVPRFGHVFVIVGENTDYSHLDAKNAPYLMETLRPQSAWLENYYAATHWSQANYVALVTGQFTRCEQQDGGAACHQDVDNLYHQLDSTRQTWKVWLEAGAAKCDTGSGGSCESDTPCPLTGFYTTGNPPILFDDIEGPNGVWSATTPSEECLANDVPAGTPTDGMATFDAALASGDVADFNTVIPNGCEDGEANCKPENNRYTQFDDFLAREVPRIESSRAFGRDGVIVVLYDEDERMGGLAAKNGLGQGGHTVCAVISPLLQPGEYETKTYSYSVLRTLQDGFGLSDYLGSAADVDPLPITWK